MFLALSLPLKNIILGTQRTSHPLLTIRNNRPSGIRALLVTELTQCFYFFDSFYYRSLVSQCVLTTGMYVIWFLKVFYCVLGFRFFGKSLRNKTQTNKCFKAQSEILVSHWTVNLFIVAKIRIHFL